MKKKYKRIPITEIQEGYWKKDVFIKKITEVCENWDEDGDVFIELEVDYEWGDYSAVIKVFGERWETDQEFQERKKLTEENEEKIKQKELAELKRLQEKYNS